MSGESQSGPEQGGLKQHRGEDLASALDRATQGDRELAVPAPVDSEAGSFYKTHLPAPREQQEADVGSVSGPEADLAASPPDQAYDHPIGPEPTAGMRVRRRAEGILARVEQTASAYRTQSAAQAELGGGFSPVAAGDAVLAQERAARTVSEVPRAEAPAPSVPERSDEHGGQDASTGAVEAGVHETGADTTRSADSAMADDGGWPGAINSVEAAKQAAKDLADYPDPEMAKSIVERQRRVDGTLPPGERYYPAPGAAGAPATEPEDWPDPAEPFPDRKRTEQGDSNVE